MEWITAILGFLSASGLAGSLLFWRENRQMKRAEARQVETNNAIAAANEWQEIARSKDEKLDKKDEKIEMLYVIINEWRDRHNALETKYHELDLKYTIQQIRLCGKRGCSEREPQTGF